MKKEISKDVIAKVFAQHIGCKMVMPKSGRIATLEGVEWDGRALRLNDGIYYRSYEHFPFQLILSDLSDISDEDAVEVAKIMCGGKSTDYEVDTMTGVGNYQNCIIVVDKTKSSITGMPYKRCEIWIKGFEVYGYYYSQTNGGFKLCSTQQHLNAIDFLRNPNKPSGNAYMLPAFGITDLFEAGIAVRKETIKK